MDLPEIVTLALDVAGGSQTELAARLHASPATISRWYSGKITPDPWSCIGLAEIAGVPPDDVLRAAGHDPRRLAVVRRSKSDRAREQVSAQRSAVRQQLEAWLDAVGPEYESLFWEKLKADGESTVRLFRSVQTAVNQSTDAAVSPGVSRARSAANGGPKGRRGPLTKDQHPPARVLITHRPTRKVA